MNSAGLRKLFKRSIRNKWNLSELEVALDLAADAWEEDQQTTADLRLVLQEQGGAMLSLRKRLEAAERQLVETILAWRAGEKPEDYPELAALAGEESPDATKNATRTDKSPEGYSIDS